METDTSASRHSNNKQPFKIAGWIIAVVVSIVVIVAIAVAWTLGHKSVSDTRTENAVQDCSAGYLTVEVWVPTEAAESVTEATSQYQGNLASDGGLCASFSLSIQSSKDARKALLKKNPYVPAVWIGETPDVLKVAEKDSTAIVTKPRPLEGTDLSIVTFDVALNDPSLLPTTTAEHTTEATQAAVDFDAYLRENGVKVEKQKPKTERSESKETTQSADPKEKTPTAD